VRGTVNSECCSCLSSLDRPLAPVSLPVRATVKLEPHTLLQCEKTCFNHGGLGVKTALCGVNDPLAIGDPPAFVRLV
jgi:hypothetical protein